jgi:hypothetical protein
MKLDKSQNTTIPQSNGLSVFVNPHIHADYQKRLHTWQQAYPQLSAANESYQGLETMMLNPAYLAVDHFMYQFGLC